MRIATWNINGMRARLDFLLHWLEARQPDVVGLQELKTTDEEFPHLPLENAGYRAVTHGQKAWNGVAVLSREAAEVTQTGLPGQEEAGARLISAQVGGVDFTTVYVPNGKTVGHQDFPRKLAWLDALADHFDGRDAQAPAVLCGDFNLCPGKLDTHDEAGRVGTIFHTDAERQRFERLLASGLIDLFRHRHPDTRMFSWWDYRGGAFHRNLGLRIDLLLGTRPLLDRVEDVWVDRDYRKKKEGLIASDHAPVIVDLT